MLAPAARTEVVRDTYFGVTVEDPYRWLEEIGSDEVRAWLDAQARHARSVLETLPHRAALRGRIAELPSGTPALSEFRVAAGAVFCLGQDADADVAALIVGDASAGPERVLLDPGGISGAAHSTIDWYVPSPDARYVACGISQGGAERSTVHVIEVDSGSVIDDAVTGVHFAFLSWLEDEGAFRSFLYHRYPDPAAGTPADQARLDSRSQLHRLGDDSSRDLVVLARDLNPRVPLSRRDRPFIAISPRGAWMLAIVSHSALGRSTTEELSDCTLYVAPRSGLADPASCPWRRVAEVEDDVTAYALSEDTLYLVIGRDAPRYRVAAVPLADPDLGRSSVVVPESRRVVEAVAVAGGHLLVRDLDGGIARLRRLPLAGAEPEDIPLPIEGSIWESAGEPDRDQVLLRLSSWTAPPRIYRCDVHSCAVEDTGWLPALPVDFGGVEAHEVQVPARDGTLIPLSIIHRKGLRRDGDNPTLLTAYGSYGYPLRPDFRPEMLAWYERGGVYAVAHVRGGGEHGREWHEAGRGLRKETTITDLIDCAEYLVAHGYTRPARLAAEGGSAGGITAGGALVRRPDLWAAIVLHVPVTNALRAELGENGPINVPEFGSLTTEPGLQGLLIMDCYLRVQDGTPYPAVLLTAGMNDPRVDVWQPAKIAARLQAATTSGRPVLLRIEEQAGHGFGSTRSQQDSLLADELAFLLDQLEPAPTLPTG
ncbi:MAG TPA: prolyl oligopeptidase family serine peptidase [Gaiellaceae bacterium]|jgi:prolyl oligopeptidase